MSNAEDILQEYVMLREEIITYFKFQDALMAFTVTTVVAILYFSISNGNPYLPVLGSIITLLMLFKTVSLRYSIMKISGYMITYLEPNLGIRWETYNRFFIANEGPDKKCGHTPGHRIFRFLPHCTWLVLAVSSLMSSIFIRKISIRGWDDGIFCIILFVMILVFIVSVIITWSVLYKSDDIRDTYWYKWSVFFKDSGEKKQIKYICYDNSSMKYHYFITIGQTLEGMDESEKQTKPTCGEYENRNDE